MTGANSAIGEGFVSLLIQRPSVTIIAGVRDPSSNSSEALSSLPKGNLSKLIPVKTDSSVESDPATAVDQLQKEHGITSLDIVIANAGISQNLHLARNSSFEIALDHFKINSAAPLVLFGAVASLLKNSTNPTFIALSLSVGSIGLQANAEKLFPGANLGAYGASKAALNFLIRRLDVEEKWLTSIVVHPGLVETDMGSGLSGVPVPRHEESWRHHD